MWKYLMSRKIIQTDPSMTCFRMQKCPCFGGQRIPPQSLWNYFSSDVGGMQVFAQYLKMPGTNWYK